MNIHLIVACVLVSLIVYVAGYTLKTHIRKVLPVMYEWFKLVMLIVFSVALLTGAFIFSVLLYNFSQSSLGTYIWGTTTIILIIVGIIKG